MRELKIVIPAIIDYCRYSNSNLGTNRHYFFWTPESKKINLVTKPVFSNDGINSLLADLNVCFSIEDVVSGRFIDSFLMNNSELQEKQFILNILKLVLINPNFKRSYYSFISNEDDVINFSKDVNLLDVKNFWQTMLDYEIFYLQKNINDLGFLEWNNFGIDVYNTLAESNNKSIIFNEVNKILSYILCPFDLHDSNFRVEEIKSSFTIYFDISILEVKSIEIEANRFKTLQQLLDFLFKGFLSKILPKYSYEQEWILENNGCLIRKNNNNEPLNLIDLGIVDGTVLTLYKLNMIAFEKKAIQ